MGSTFTDNGGIEKIGLGEQAGSWGTTTNTNFDIIDRLINGVGAIALSGTTHTLTTSDGSLSDGMFKVLVLGGSPSGTNTITISPNNADKLYFVKNDTSQTAIFTQGSGGNVSIATGKGAIIFADGAGSSAAVTDLTALFTTSQAIDGVVVGGTTPAAGTFTTLTATSVTANGGVTVDNINIDGTEIDLSSGDLTVDVAGDINLDADGGQVHFKDGGTEIGILENSSSDFKIEARQQDKDIIFAGNDGGSGITALTLDMSEAGNATFNGTVTTTGLTLGSTAVNATADELNLLDGDTSVGSSITVADADGIIVNDGGTMKTIPASAIKTYATAGATSGTVTSVSGGTGISGTVTTSGSLSLNTGLGEVGTYAFLAIVADTTIKAGETYTRSSSGADNNNQNLIYSGLLMDAGNNFDDDTALDASGSVTTNLTGIWRAMGDARNTNRRAATLFLRIS